MPYAGEYGGCVLSATVNLFVYASVLRRPYGDEGARPGPERSDDVDRAFDAARELLGVPADPRDECRSHAGGLRGSGLGTSSAAIVAMLAALGERGACPMATADLARLAYRVEREKLGHLGGAQDHYSAAFGGVNLIEFGADGAGFVRPLRLAPQTLRRLESSLLLCDTGARRDSGEILRGQVAQVTMRDQPSLQALHTMKALALDMKELLLRGDVAGFGELMGKAWEQKQVLLAGAGRGRTSALGSAARLIDAARAAGAVSGRMLGAGGGGFLLLFLPPRRRGAVVRALEAAGGQARPVTLCASGAAVSATGMRHRYGHTREGEA
jgi:D-glycero-alpha-D-manno-heptose-7-phosphate kinase